MFGKKNKKNRESETINSIKSSRQGKYTLPCVLSIAGSDSSGGAGIQADIKTISSLGMFAETVISAITAQNTMGVIATQNIDVEIIEAQIDAVFADIVPKAVKVGMVSTSEIAQTIATSLTQNKAKNIVVDPVMVSTSGCSLAQADVARAMQKYLFPIASVITPNIPEAQAFVGFDIECAEDALRAAHVLQDMAACNSRSGGCAVLIKGGHGLAGKERSDKSSPEGEKPCYADDLLLSVDGEEIWMYANHISNPNTHGTGCTLSSAIASYLAVGQSVPRAVGAAKEYISGALSAQLDLGHASGPIDHFWQQR